MTVNSFNIEFGYELLSALPYAYELHLQGKLKETISGFDTEPLYYFSPKHTINNQNRNWFNTQIARDNHLPYTTIHAPERPELKFPPYKEIYKNKEFKFKKPTICICNRYNIEWSFKAINYFDLNILDWMFSNLKKDYEIIYFAVDLPTEFYDGVEPLKLNDIEIAKKHGIQVFQNIKGKSWNESILKVFANCEHYITMNGGYSILASMFSGTNIIYSVPSQDENQVETREIKNKSFWRWYPNINNVRTLHVPSHNELKQKITSLYIDKEPCLNIIVRTNRPNYLRNCIKSIKEQSYQNINLVLVCDNMESVKYTREYDARMIKVTNDYKQGPKPINPEYGIYFPYNRYLSEVQKLVKGYILMLDDDDKLINRKSVSCIMSNVKKNELTVWKVDMKGFGIIPKHSFNKSIELYDITGIGMCYHSSQIHLTDWSEWKRADYRTAKKLSQNLKVNWIDLILTGIQDKPGMGKKQDIDDFVTVKILTGTKQRMQCFERREWPTIKLHLEKQGMQCIEMQ